MAEIWGAVAAAVVGAGSAVYSANQQKKAASKALDTQRGIADDIKYEPIDIEKLKRDAQAAAIENATASLAIERQLAPDVASVRTELARQVNADLAKGGDLPADIVNRVSQAARVSGVRSGNGVGSTTPLTASLLGISSLDLTNKRRSDAANLLAQNPLPVSGLDPGTLASLEVAENAANNQFNLEKAGVSSNLANSEAAARAAQIAGQTGVASSLANLIGKGASLYATNSGSSNYDDLLKKTRTPITFTNQNPSLNPIMGGGSLMVT